MRPSDIEYWALSVIDRVLNKLPLEDSRVEIKATWPEPKGAARRIAGHANAARGEAILWLIGLDERNATINGAEKSEMAEWWPSAQTHFNEIAPSVVDLIVPQVGKAVVALLFDTSRAPFVVKNPVFGTTNGGPVSLEVPWREGTVTRSATHSDLIKLLVPLETLPSIEPLSVSLHAEQARDAKDFLRWGLEARLYVTSHYSEPLVIPKHRYEIAFEVPNGIPWTNFDDTRLRPPRSIHVRGTTNMSLTVDSTNSEVIINRAGLMILHAFTKSSIPTDPCSSSAHVTGTFRTSHDDRPIVIDVTLDRILQKETHWGDWSMRKSKK